MILNLMYGVCYVLYGTKLYINFVVPRGKTS